MAAEQLLVATGRIPRTDGLAVMVAGVQTDGHGFIEIDEHQRTTNPRVYAAGVVCGAPQYVYVAAQSGREGRRPRSANPATVDCRGLPAIAATTRSSPVPASPSSRPTPAVIGESRVLSARDDPGALVNRDTRGAAKIVGDTDSRAVPGAHAALDGAGDITPAATYAIRGRTTVDEVADIWAPCAGPRPADRLPGPVVRAMALGLLVIALALCAHALGFDDVAALRSRATSSGVVGVLVFGLAYVGVTLTPLPKSVLSATAGAVFGFATGLAVVWLAAVTGALLAFGLARRLSGGNALLTGAEAGPLARLNALVGSRGVVGVLLVRLVPILPFTVINYGSGFTTLRLRHYALGTAIGIVPGSAAYVAVGAGATESWRTSVAGAFALVALLAGGVLVRRRRDRRGAG